MNQKEYQDFIYLLKEDYDSQVKINDEELKVYSKKKLNDLFPNKDYEIVGETFEDKKRDKKKDIGRIELNEKRLNVGANGDYCKIFKKQSTFVAVNGGGYIALLKTRLLPIILICALVLGGIACGLCNILNQKPADPVETSKAQETVDPGIKEIETDILTISGSVTKGNEAVEGATISLLKGSEEIFKTTTDKNGKYLLNDVKNGNYNLICTNAESSLLKIATVNGASIKVNFIFPANDLHDVEDITDHHKKEDLPEVVPTEENTDVKSMVKLPEGTPAIALGGFETEAMLHMIVGKEVDLTFFAEKLPEERVPELDKKAITSITGDLEITYFDFSVLKEIFKNKVLESSEYLKNTKTVLEVAVPYDSSKAIGTYVFRFHDEKAMRFTELSKKPAGNFTDGTYFVTADTVYVYTNCFSTYAIGSVSAGQVVKGSDTITYSSTATINLTTQKIEMLFKHDLDSTNDAKIELYLVGENSNLLVAESGIIPVGYQITEMSLKSGIANMPSVGTYKGLMKIIYLAGEGNTATNVDIPLDIAITQ